MAILELRILPPLAVGRLGASPTPLEAFDLQIPRERPLDYREIVPRETFRIDPDSGQIAECYVPDSIRFKEKNREIRPVAPFLEVFAITDSAPDELVPLTVYLLEEEGLSVDCLHWNVWVANIKIFRRTGNKADQINAVMRGIQDHQSHALLGECENFLPGKQLPLGSVQFIRPTGEFPQIRLRFTPAAGKVYGSSLKRHTSPTTVEDDPVITSQDLILYDETKGWRGYKESSGPTLTNPAQIFAGYYWDGSQVSWGYLDDECDGFVSVTLDDGRGERLRAHAPGEDLRADPHSERLRAHAHGHRLRAHAHIGAGPPAFAPDTMPVRVISDELEQILLGPEVEGEVPIEEAEKIVFRALETVRLMNTAVMNGNSIDGRENVASTMVRQDTNDFERLYEPIMATSIVDNLAVLALHERVFNGLSSGAAPWFSEVLRRPDEIGDLSNQSRRKMPALMRNADGRGLTLTHRQINTVIRAAAQAMFRTAEGEGPHRRGGSDE